MKITGTLLDINGSMIGHIEIKIPDVFLTRRDQLALAAPNHPRYAEDNHDVAEKRKAEEDDRYIMKSFSAMEWKYLWADKMIAASEVTL